MMTEMARLKKTKTTLAKDYGGKTRDNIKKVGGKVVGGIINESKEEDNDDNKGPQKHCSNRKK
jgi:hypothetical protein